MGNVASARQLTPAIDPSDTSPSKMAETKQSNLLLRTVASKGQERSKTADYSNANTKKA